MELKFYLNKFLKVDNIEGYTLGTLEELRKSYDRFLEKSGFDPDFPMLALGSGASSSPEGNGGSDKLKFEKGNNIHNFQKEGETIEETKSRLSLGYSDFDDNGSLTLHK